MYTLTYESVATNKLKTPEMEELLEKARANNKRDDITGCLIYYKGGFVQLLEGNKKKINELYDKIKKDPRHKNVTLFSDDEISERTFPNWGMAYYPIDENNTTKYEYEQFKRNLILMADLIESTNVTSKQFWKKIKTMISEPPM
ncbi:BLUF domain-containing protein [Maribacter sp. SA7]|uniref:BLUF domain-containing protein n=1 Tax=Maribacter zhoushanensis TaxID=3030012 RepID=UPI0023EB1FCF|nr:BLUF domain-containing protein [Maribacter zhoushanensis]MDF4203826.1 BLUF domain-containing protein [Maribacter zhoushanensis]